MRINNVYKSFAEFVAHHGDEPFESFFAAACTWRKTLCAERVFGVHNVYAEHGSERNLF